MNRSPKGVGALAALLLAAPAILAAQPGPAPRVLHDQPVPMRDGVKLAADVYLPAGTNGAAQNGRFPVILMRTPYDKLVRAPDFADYFTAHGYAVVVEDIRGRYASGGHWSFTGVDANDGYDTTAWIGRQPWSDGKIGTVGTSYEGGTQHAMALAGAPHLTAMVPLFAVSNIGEYGIRHDGAFELRFFNWVFSMGEPGDPAPKAAARAAADPAAVPALTDLQAHVEEYVQALPLRAGTTPLRFAPDYERWLVEGLGHGDDDAFWTDSGFDILHHVADYADVPAYHVTGWYDSWSHDVADINFPLLRAAKKSPQRLIVGPWIHSSPESTHAGGAQFTDDAAIDLNEFQRRWFDHYIKGVDNGVDREPPVRIYVMGGGDGHKTADGRIFVGGHWRTEQEWPLARARATAWYLHPGGVLSPEPPAPTAEPVSYLFDPKHPVPTLGGNTSSQGRLSTQGVADQRCHKGVGLCTDDLPLSARNDIVVFQSAPLAHDMEITGPLVVKLWASTDGPDTDFTAKLIDQYPPNADFPAGYDLNIDDGIVRARYRNSLAHAEPMKPGQPVELTIQLYPTSLLIKAGHRLRLDISSSNFPRFDVNPNTGEPLNGNRRVRTAVNAVWLDAGHPSRVVLPVVGE
jgi:putative CocE/NonD family hydrolase